MKIKTISDEEWNGFCVKPFIFVGFNKYKTGLVAIAISDESLCECRPIKNSHSARQEAFAHIHSRYSDSPIAILDQKTERFLANILNEKSGQNTSLKLILKGPPQRLRAWETELWDALKIGCNTKLSEDNPIQWTAL
ncbi:MAG: hypothetical protein LBI77_02865 [Puniceicoccales bacterium]|jgi:hypothetical protein|nr:hypothetical protein [Puniceicoccales bacterium]